MRAPATSGEMFATELGPIVSLLLTLVDVVGGDGWDAVGGGVAAWLGVFVALVLGGEELVEFGEAAVVVGLVDYLLGGLEVVGDGWLVLV